LRSQLIGMMEYWDVGFGGKKEEKKGSVRVNVSMFKILLFFFSPLFNLLTLNKVVEKEK
jgi:hypothetical protein